jgi:Xaa-Pro dipeptidase
MKPLDNAFYKRRVESIRERLAVTKFDGLLLLDIHNVIYASGFFHIPSERPLGLYIPMIGEPVLFIPLLEKENASDTWIADIRSYFEYPGEEYPVNWMVRTCGAKRLGIDHLSHHIFQTLDPEHVSITTLVHEMRWVKEPEEIALVKLAASYADTCLEYVRDHAPDIIGDGGTELDILAACLSFTLDKMQHDLESKFGRRRLGITGTVHSGPRAALPHGEPGNRIPQIGDTLIAGIGASVGGYHAESGATFIIGEPSDDQMHCMQAAVDCDRAAVNQLRVGATCEDVNAAALKVLREAGLGDAIRHRIGHGMGLQGHEGPWLAPGDRTVLKPNMVFSNEPGIYRPGIDGYRTINSMIVTDGEASVPSCFLAHNPPEERIISL